jgi:hypothetical protein
MRTCLSLSRVLALIGGLSLVAAFFMPWFSSQGLLLSGQFTHTFLSNANATDLRRFLPISSPAEVQLLRALVDLFPACGALAAATSLLGGLVHGRRVILDAIGMLAGAAALLAWLIGISRLPPGANPEVGLGLMAGAALAILIGLGMEFVSGRAGSEVHS